MIYIAVLSSLIATSNGQLGLNDFPNTPKGGIFCGSIETDTTSGARNVDADHFHIYAFDLNCDGCSFTLSTNDQTTDFDTEIVVYDQDGTIIASNDDVNVENEFSVVDVVSSCDVITYQIRVGGAIKVADPGETGTYQLSLTCAFKDPVECPTTTTVMSTTMSQGDDGSDSSESDESSDESSSAESAIMVNREQNEMEYFRDSMGSNQNMKDEKEVTYTLKLSNEVWMNIFVIFGLCMFGNACLYMFCFMKRKIHN